MESTKNVNVDIAAEVGQVQIADDVISVIAEIAALEVEGITQIGSAKNDIVNTIRGKKTTKGIRVEITESEVLVDIICLVKYGIKIQNICLKVQEKVKNSIETMTGLTVQAVNVHVVGVTFAKTTVADEYKPLG